MDFDAFIVCKLVVFLKFFAVGLFQKLGEALTWMNVLIDLHQDLIGNLQFLLSGNLTH